MGGSREVLMQICLSIQNVHLIILILAEAGGVRIRQQDEFSEAMEVGNTAESLQHEHHGNQAKEEVCCRHGGGETGKLMAQLSAQAPGQQGCGPSGASPLGQLGGSWNPFNTS